MKGLSPEQARHFLGLVAGAAPPSDRLSGRHFVPVATPPSTIADRMARWRAAVANDEASLEDILTRLDTTEEDTAASLRDVAVRNPEDLPAWADALLDLLSALPGDVPPALSSTRDASFHLLRELRNAVRDAAGRMLHRTLASCPISVSISAEARGQISAQLADRVMTACGPSLTFETQAARLAHAVGHGVPALGRDLDGWLTRLELLPGLTYVVGTLCEHWLDATRELLRRLDRDLDVLRRDLWEGCDPGALVALQGDAGDPHDGGRSVSILTFANGQRVVYKTKDLRSAAGFMELVGFLNEHGLSPSLPTRTIFPRKGYGWEEFVLASPCRNPAQARRFYLRMGMTIRLVQFLEGRDFWLDNVLATGEGPVLVDLETLLQARVPDPPSSTRAERAARHLMEESVVRTALVASPVLIEPGVQAEDMAAVTPVRDFRTPLRIAPGRGQEESAAPGSNGRFATWSGPEYAPMLHGAPVDALDHLGEIVAGYECMQDCLTGNRQALRAADGPLQAMIDAPVRHIVRDTWSYYNVMSDSLSPTALADGVERELRLARLYRLWGGPGTVSGDVRVVQREIAALRGMDVPLFQSHPRQDRLFVTAGDEVAKGLHGTAAGRLRDRVEELPVFDTGLHVDILRSCLDGARGGAPSAPAKPMSRLRPLSRRGSRDWEGLAAGIGRSIMAEAFTSREGDAAWLGQTYDPWHDLLVIEPISTDLLTGTAGLAVLFCDLYRVTRDVAFLEIAERTLGGLARRGTVGAPDGGDCGAFVGAGAIIYALSRGAAALERPGWRDEASRCVDRLRLDQLRDRCPVGVVSGLAGLMAVLASAPGGPSSREATLEGIASALGSPSAARRPRFPEGATRLDGLPRGSAGLTWALTRLIRTCPPLADRAAEVREMIRGGPAAPRSVGDVLAALDSSGSHRDAGIAAASHLLDEEPFHLDSTGLLDRIEVGVTAFQSTGDAAFLHSAERMAGHLVMGHERSGSWFPHRAVADRFNTSIIWGTAALAHVLLRLAAPQTVASVRLVGPPIGQSDVPPEKPNPPLPQP